MIHDFNEYQDGSSIEADICIIGAGAAGIAIAREFLGSRLKVLVLEGGGLRPEAGSQELFQSEIAGLPHTSIHEGRARIFGGTTTLWGGQALRFDPFDFATKSWVPYSGWPICSEVLAPYYERAERVLHLGRRISFEELCSSFRVETPNFNPDKIVVECSRWSPKPQFRNGVSSTAESGSQYHLPSSCERDCNRHYPGRKLRRKNRIQDAGRQARSRKSKLVHPLWRRDRVRANPLHEWRAFNDYTSAFGRRCRALGAAGDYYTQVAMEIL